MINPTIPFTNAHRSFYCSSSSSFFFLFLLFFIGYSCHHSQLVVEQNSSGATFASVVEYMQFCCNIFNSGADMYIIHSELVFHTK